jgi:predicted DsbA family dithiol-disulfide isomerase
VVHRGFEIHPEVPLEGMPLEEYFPNASQMFGGLKAMGQPYGVEFNHLTMMPNTNLALQVAEYAKEIGLSESYNKLMYKATFVDDVNISLKEEINKIAIQAGFTESDLQAVYSTDKYKKILEDNKLYCQTHNISSVPTFIINEEYAIVGAQGPESFKKIFQQLKTGKKMF